MQETSFMQVVMGIIWTLVSGLVGFLIAGANPAWAARWDARRRKFFGVKPRAGG